MNEQFYNQNNQTQAGAETLGRADIALTQGGVSEVDASMVYMVGVYDLSPSMTEPLSSGVSKAGAMKSAITKKILKIPASKVQYCGIVFADDYQVFCPLGSVAGQKAQIIKGIQSLSPYGCGTNPCGPLEYVLNSLSSIPSGSSVVVHLLTDGEFQSDPSHLVDQLKKRGVVIKTIGFGESTGCFDEAALQRLASRDSNGNPFYVHCSSVFELDTYMTTEGTTMGGSL